MSSGASLELATSGSGKNEVGQMHLTQADVGLSMTKNHLLYIKTTQLINNNDNYDVIVSIKTVILCSFLLYLFISIM